MRPDRRRALRVFGTVWAALAALTVLWSLATPISASPDEPAHLVKAAAVVRGQWTGPMSADGNVVTVPLYIAWTHAVTCFAFNDEVTADCAPPMPGDPGEPTTSATTAGTYNPLYYLLVGWPSLIADDNWGIYAMRIVSAIVTTLFAAAAAALLSFWTRRLLPWTALVALCTPMLLFLGGSVNPNALETTTTLATAAAMLSIVRFPDRVPRGLAYAVLITAAVVGVNTRALAPLWILVALLVPLVLVGRRALGALLRSRATIAAIIAIGVATAAAVAWMLGSGSLAPDPDADENYPGTGQAPFVGFLFVFERTLSFGAQMIGLFGWTDTPAPTAVLFIWTMLVGGILIGALALARGRELLAFWAGVGALVLLPALLQAAFVGSGGFIWQGRYALPLLTVAVLVAAVALDSATKPAPRAARRLILLGAIAVPLAQLYTFAFVLKRYTNGSSDTWLGFIQEPMWNAPGGNLVLVGVFAVLSAGSAVLVARGMLRASTDNAHELQPRADDRPHGEGDGHAHEQLAR